MIRACIPIIFELGEARFTQLYVSNALPRVKLVTRDAPRDATLMVYGFVPPDILRGKTSQLVIDFVVLVVIDTEEVGFWA